MHHHRPLQPTTFYSNSPKSLFSQPQRTTTGTLSRHHSSKVFQQELTQFESVIEQQRRKYKENKVKSEQDVEGERRKRIELEGKLLKMKEELARRDKDKAEVQYRMGAIENDLQDYRADNERLKRDLEAAAEAYTHRIAELETQLTTEDQQHRETIEKYNEEFEKFKKQGQLYIETMTFEYDRKTRNLQEKLRACENSKKELGKDGKRLHDMMMDQQIGYEEEIRSAVNRVREEQTRKYTNNLKNIENKLRASQEIRETLSRKNHQLLKIVQQKQHQLTTLSIQKAQQCSRYQQQITQHRDRLQQFKLLLDKCSSQITRKDQQLSRLCNDYNPDQTLLKQQFQAKKRQVQSLSQTITQLRQSIKEMNSENERKRNELVERSNFFESEYKRYKSENATIWQSVKSKVNQTISQQVSRG